MKNKLQTAMCALLFLLMAAFPQAAAQGVRNALEICLEMVIPSLFPLMFASLLLTKSCGNGKLSRTIGKPVKILFGVPECGAKAIASAVLGGYPAGAAAVSSMYKEGQLTKAEAEKLAYVAVSAGPAFVIGAVGSGIYSSVTIGIMLLSVQILSVIIVGMIIHFLESEKTSYKQLATEKINNKNIFVISASDSARSLLSVCTFVVLFGAIGGLITALRIDSAAAYVLKMLKVPDKIADSAIMMLLEVSSGCIKASKISIEAVAFVLGFGGFSVHFQIYSLVCQLGVNKLKFTLLRFGQGVICALLAYFAKMLLPNEVVETAALSAPKAMPSVTGCVCLVIMCLMMLFCCPIHLTKKE